MSSQHVTEALIHPQGIAFMMEEPSSNHVFKKTLAMCLVLFSNLLVFILYLQRFFMQLKLRHTYKDTYLYLYSVINEANQYSFISTACTHFNSAFHTNLFLSQQRIPEMYTDF